MNIELLKNRQDYRNSLIWRLNGSRSLERQEIIVKKLKSVEFDINMIKRGLLT